MDSNNLLFQNSEKGDKQIDILIFKIDKYGNTVSIKNNNNSSIVFDYNVYPNPYNLTFKIKLNIAIRYNIVISLYDVSGRIVKKIDRGIFDKGKYEINVNTPELSSGVYFVKVDIGNNFYSKKILLIK